MISMQCIIYYLQVLLRDPLDDNVIPVVEELRRRLPLLNNTREDHGEGKELGGHNDGEAGEEDGKFFLT